VVRDGTDPSRRIGNSAVIKARAFFELNENHNFLFEEIDQRNDIGIDAILTLARSGPDAGLSVNLQIKGGRKYKRQLHVDERYNRRGMANYRRADWKLWADISPPRGFEGHHVIDMDERLRAIWRNCRPIYVIVHDPDDDQLYYGNLARMADVEPLEQDLARSWKRRTEPDISQWRDRSCPGCGRRDLSEQRFYDYMTSVHEKVSRLSEDKLRLHKTWIPLYPDLRLTPDGLERFLTEARAEARQPIPDYSDPGGEIPIYVTYPDGTIGLSREVLDNRRRRELND
jgi:hypothetical protein